MKGIRMGEKNKNEQKKERPKRILQFKIVLGGIEPAIWRSIQVSNEMNMRTFAVSLLLAMGWQNSHLHEFIIAGIHYGLTGDDYDYIDESLVPEDETLYRLKDFSEDQLRKFKFLYDFGDGWKHDVSLEVVILKPDAVAKFPRVVDGARNCPPEDCGGISGYYDLAEKLKTPDAEDYEGLITWLGGKYDTDFFDLNVINTTLKKTVAYEKYGFEHDESAGDILFEDEYINCGIGLAKPRKTKKNKTPARKKNSVAKSKTIIH